METIKAIDALLDIDAYRALKGRIEIDGAASARDFPLKNIPLRRAGFFSGYLWEQLEFPLMHAAGRLLLNLCMLGPLLTRHQLWSCTTPPCARCRTTFPARFRAAYGFLLPRLCRRAEQSMTVSEFSRQEIGKWYGADTTAAADLPRGRRPHRPRSRPILPCCNRFDLVGRKFFLGVGVDSANKNIATVAQGIPQGQARRHRAGADRLPRTPRCSASSTRVQSDSRAHGRLYLRTRTAHALRARARAGLSRPLRRVRPAAARGHDAAAAR